MELLHIIRIRSSFCYLGKYGMLGYDSSRRKKLEAMGFHQVLQLYERIISMSVSS